MRGTGNEQGEVFRFRRKNKGNDRFLQRLQDSKLSGEEKSLTPKNIYLRCLVSGKEKDISKEDGNSSERKAKGERKNKRVNGRKKVERTHLS